jgi:hypothetical protein
MRFLALAAVIVMVGGASGACAQDRWILDGPSAIPELEDLPKANPRDRAVLFALMIDDEYAPSPPKQVLYPECATQAEKDAIDVAVDLWRRADTDYDDDLDALHVDMPALRLKDPASVAAYKQSYAAHLSAVRRIDIDLQMIWYAYDKFFDLMEAASQRGCGPPHEFPVTPGPGPAPGPGPSVAPPPPPPRVSTICPKCRWIADQIEDLDAKIASWVRQEASLRKYGGRKDPGIAQALKEMDADLVRWRAKKASLEAEQAGCEKACRLPQPSSLAPPPNQDQHSSVLDQHALDQTVMAPGSAPMPPAAQPNRKGGEDTQAGSDGRSP